MSWETQRPFVRDDGETEIEVTVCVEHPGSRGNGWDDAGDGPELSIICAHLLIRKPTDPNEIAKWSRGLPPYDDAICLVELTDAERERIEGELHSDTAWIDDHYDDGPDWDADRDAQIDARLCGEDY